MLLIDITIAIANKFIAKRKKEVVGCLRMNPISEERMAGERKKRDERKKERERERERMEERIDECSTGALGLAEANCR